MRSTTTSKLNLTVASTLFGWGMGALLNFLPVKAPVALICAALLLYLWELTKILWVGRRGKTAIMLVGLIVVVFVYFHAPAFITKKYIEQQIPKQSEEIKLTIDKKIFLLEKYGGEWHGSPVKPIVFSDEKSILRSTFTEGRKYRFTPTIYNGNRSITISAELFLNLPSEVTVDETKLWRLTDKDGEFNQYAAIFPINVPPESTNTMNESIFLSFPKPGRYKATYSIHGTGSNGEGFTTGIRAFYFELTNDN